MDNCKWGAKAQINAHLRSGAESGANNELESLAIQELSMFNLLREQAEAAIACERKIGTKVKMVLCDQLTVARGNSPASTTWGARNCRP